MKHMTIECSHFLGEKPCKLHPDCAGSACVDYKKYGPRILIIKLDAIGDVLRTTPILPEIKKRYPHCHVTWVASAVSREILDRNPYIHRVITARPEEMFPLLEEWFDIVYSFDKVPVATALANKVHAHKKVGFCMNRYGKLGCFNKASEYAFRLGFNDTLKFKKNRKTYQEMIFDMCGFNGRYGEYVYETDPAAVKEAEELLKAWGIKADDSVIGLNTGAGKVFETKKWPAELFVKLARLLLEKQKVKILILGGPEEELLNASIAHELGGNAIHAGTKNSLKVFFEIIGRCDAVVTADTLAMHLAIAKKRNVIALFGATSAHEIDLYGRGIKISKDRPCAPCYRSSCDDMQCMHAITPEEVCAACDALL
jgi:heptosyltransferase-2